MTPIAPNYIEKFIEKRDPAIDCLEHFFVLVRGEQFEKAEELIIKCPPTEQEKLSIYLLMKRTCYLEASNRLKDYLRKQNFPNTEECQELDLYLWDVWLDKKLRRPLQHESGDAKGRTIALDLNKIYCPTQKKWTSTHPLLTITKVFMNVFCSDFKEAEKWIDLFLQDSGLARLTNKLPWTFPTITICYYLGQAKLRCDPGSSLDKKLSLVVASLGDASSMISKKEQAIVSSFLNEVTVAQMSYGFSIAEKLRHFLSFCTTVSTDTLLFTFKEENNREEELINLLDVLKKLTITPELAKVAIDLINCNGTSDPAQSLALGILTASLKGREEEARKHFEAAKGGIKNSRLKELLALNIAVLQINTPDEACLYPQV